MREPSESRILPCTRDDFMTVRVVTQFVVHESLDNPQDIVAPSVPKDGSGRNQSCKTGVGEFHREREPLICGSSSIFYLVA